MPKFLKLCFSLLFMFSLAWAEPNFEETKAKAEAGDANAQYNLGLMYRKEQDYVKAAEWYLKAAEQGFADAQYDLGVMYDKGYGVKQDDAKAMEWQLKAARQSYADRKEGLEKLGLE